MRDDTAKRERERERERERVAAGERMDCCGSSVTISCLMFVGEDRQGLVG
jgi:hypothetical protein